MNFWLDDLAMAKTERRADVWQIGVREGVEDTGIWRWIGHRVLVPGTNRKYVERFGGRQQCALGLLLGERFQDRPFSLIICRVLERRPALEGGHGEMVPDIPGADEEQDAVVLRQKIQQLGPGAHWSAERAVFVAQR
jgi:hypothetical protein